MKSLFLFSFLLFSSTVYVQEITASKPKLILYSSLFDAKLRYTTPLSEKLNLYSELGISKAFNHSSISYVPLAFEYHLTKKWKVFGGSKLSYNFVNNDFYLGTQSSFNLLIQVGTRYDFNKAFFGEVLLSYPILQKTYGQNYNPTLSPIPFALKIGSKF